MPNRHTPLPPSLIPPTGPERRTKERHTCQREAPFRYGDAFGTAKLCDLSAGGVGMVTPRQLLPGTLVTVELHDRPRNSWRLKLLEVVHATPHTSDTWLVGTRFTRDLTGDELQGLLAS